MRWSSRICAHCLRTGQAHRDDTSGAVAVKLCCQFPFDRSKILLLAAVKSFRRALLSLLLSLSFWLDNPARLCFGLEFVPVRSWELYTLQHAAVSDPAESAHRP